MKHFILVALFICAIADANAQKNDKSPFDSLKDWGNQKPTLIYVFASWCGGNMEQFNSVADTIKEYRDNFNLVILIDTSGKQFNKVEKKQVLFTADTIINIIDYYRYRLTKRSEMKKMTVDFNNRFGTEIFRLGPASMLLIERNNKFKKIFSSAKELSQYFRRKRENSVESGVKQETKGGVFQIQILNEQVH